MKKNVLLLFLILVLIFTTSCNKQEDSQEIGDYSDVTIRLAQQYGMQYAPVYVMQELELLEKLLPGVNLEWNNFGGGSAINEALISNHLDVGFMGIPPALIAMDKGADYRIACGICVPPAELIVRSDIGITSLEDIKPEHKIAVPSIGSIQHIMLSLASKEIVNDKNYLDNNLVAMANPDAYTALISETDVIGHFASMPYIDLEIKDGMQSILSADDIGGGASIICVTTDDFRNNLELSEALMTALSQSIDLINAQDEEVLKIISETEKITIEEAKEYINWPGTIYTTDLYKVNELADYMYGAGYISNRVEDINNITWRSAREAYN